MNVRKLCMMVLAGTLMTAAPASLSFAQDQPQPGGERRERGNFNPEEFRARMETRMKEQLGVNDDEWKVIQPKLEKVTAAQRESRGGGFGGFGGGRSRGGDQPRTGGDTATASTDRPQSAVSKASSDLRTVLENKDASADDIKAKLTALREARAAAKANLDAAQKELKEVLTARQEAVFVSMGTLE